MADPYQKLNSTSDVATLNLELVQAENIPTKSICNR